MLKQKETSNGALQFPELRQSPPMSLGKPVHEANNMPGVITPAANNDVLLYGDFSGT
jgi:predicted phage gp36 major capsid-like protein